MDKLFRYIRRKDAGGAAESDVMADDGAGKVYLMSGGCLWCTDVRRELNNGAWADPAQEPHPTADAKCFVPQPALDFRPTRLVLETRSGKRACVTGIGDVHGLQRSVVVVLDLASASDAGVEDAGDSFLLIRKSTVQWKEIDEYHFREDPGPGLSVRTALWHPDSFSHLAILTSDNMWRLYNTQRDAGTAELVVELSTQPRRKGGHAYGLLAGGAVGDRSRVSEVVDFAFAPAADSWTRFAVFLLERGGRLLLLCPVAPAGVSYSTATIQELHWEGDSEAAAGAACRRWLQQTFPTFSAAAPAEALHEAQPIKGGADAPAALQVLAGSCTMDEVAALGPVVPEAARPIAAEALHVLSHPAAAAGPERGGCESCAIAALVATSAGQLVAYHLLQHPAPAWSGVPAPQAAAGGGGGGGARFLPALPAAARDRSGAVADAGVAALDVVDLQAESAPAAEREEEGAEVPALRMRVHAGCPDRVVCLLRGRAALVQLGWLRHLAQRLPDTDDAALPEVSVARMSACGGGAAPPGLQPTAGFCAVGDAVLGLRALVLAGDALACLAAPRPAPEPLPEPGPAGAEEDDLLGRVLSDLERVYHTAISGCRVPDAKPGGDSLQVLRSSIETQLMPQVRHVLRCRSELEQRHTQTAQEAREMEDVSRLHRQLQAVLDNGAVLQDRVARAADFHSNLQQRSSCLRDVLLLSSQLPLPLSARERSFQAGLQSAQQRSREFQHSLHHTLLPKLAAVRAARAQAAVEPGSGADSRPLPRSQQLEVEARLHALQGLIRDTQSTLTLVDRMVQA